MKGRIWLVVVLAGTLVSCSADRRQDGASEEQEPPIESVTRWTSKTELFMEFPALVQGENAAFAVHLTDLATHRPIEAGVTTLLLEGPDRSLEFSSRQPSRPGIFRLDVRPEAAGRYRASLRIQAPHLEDRHELGTLIVHAGAAAARAQPEPAGEGEGIRFLKEQQWTSDFATETAIPRTIEESQQVPAVVCVRGGGEGSAISPVRGRLSSSQRLPVPGERVRKGEVIALVIPFTPSPQDPAGLRLDLAQAETDLAQTQSLRERLENLLAQQAIPGRRVQDARADEERARARFLAAQRRLEQYERTRSGNAEAGAGDSFQVRAPLSGVVNRVDAVAGGTVEPGQELLHLTDIERVWVVAEVPESDAEVLKTLKRAALQIGSEWIDVPGPRGRIERVGHAVNPESRRIPVVFDVANGDASLRIGQSLPVRLGRGPAPERVSVPLSAVVDDGGRPVVFIQLDGESFARKPVKTGPRDARHVQILEGIDPGDRVVSRGAYHIRLAAMSTRIPAHGHVH